LPRGDESGKTRAVRALVTGGSGYVGRVLVEALMARGYEARVFDAEGDPDRARAVEFVVGDIRDAASVRRACEGIDVIFHAVAAVPLAKDASLFRAVNVGGVQNLLDAAVQAKVRKTVVVSSSAVFGIPAKNPVDESTPLRPEEPYGEAKLEAERVAASYVARGLDVTVLRPRTIVGRDRLGIFQVLFELVRRGRPVYVLGRGDNLYQFLDPGDFADACVRAGEHAGADVFNVGAERFGTMREALEALARHADTGTVVRSLPRRTGERLMALASTLRVAPLAPYHARMYGREIYFDMAKVKAKLGWRASRSNEEMLVESYDHYVRRREEILRRGKASRHRSPVSWGILRLLELLP
jgi:nucleoside-diphosphate-sugar epimerase